MTSSKLTIEYSAKDIMKKLDEIHAQVKLTNGRVTVAEKDVKYIKRKSIGVWIGNNPFKFVLIVLIFTAIVISDIRHPFIGLIKDLLSFT